LEFDIDIFSIECEYFSCGFDINEGLDEGFCVEYESFSFDPIITALPFESRKSEFVEFKNIATKNFDLYPTLAHIGLKRLMDFGLSILPRPLIHDAIIFRQMTYMLARYDYVYLFSDWA